MLSFFPEISLLLAASSLSWLFSELLLPLSNASLRYLWKAQLLWGTSSLQLSFCSRSTSARIYSLHSTLFHTIQFPVPTPYLIRTPPSTLHTLHPTLSTPDSILYTLYATVTGEEYTRLRRLKYNLFRLKVVYVIAFGFVGWYFFLNLLIAFHWEYYRNRQRYSLVPFFQTDFPVLHSSGKTDPFLATAPAAKLAKTPGVWSISFLTQQTHVTVVYRDS